MGVEYALSDPLRSIVSRVEFTLDCTMGTVAPKEEVAMKQTDLKYVSDLNRNLHRQQRTYIRQGVPLRTAQVNHPSAPGS